jgi:hypothetical protein
MGGTAGVIEKCRDGRDEQSRDGTEVEGGWGWEAIKGPDNGTGKEACNGLVGPFDSLCCIFDTSGDNRLRSVRREVAGRKKRL